MSDIGYRPPRKNPFDGKLGFDPAVTARTKEMSRRLAAGKLVQGVTAPRWRLMKPTFQSMLTQPSPGAFRGSSPSVFPALTEPVPVKAPWTPDGDAPHAGDLSDVAAAIFALPAVQELARKAAEKGLDDMDAAWRDWLEAPPLKKTGTVALATLVLGGAIYPIISNQKRRDIAFGLIKDQEIPVPGVEGMTFTILDHGGGLSAPLGVPGLSGGGELEFENSKVTSYKVTIKFDLGEFHKARAAKQKAKMAIEFGP